MGALALITGVLRIDLSLRLLFMIFTVLVAYVIHLLDSVHHHEHYD